MNEGVTSNLAGAIILQRNSDIIQEKLPIKKKFKKKVFCESFAESMLWMIERIIQPYATRAVVWQSVAYPHLR